MIVTNTIPTKLNSNVILTRIKNKLREAAIYREDNILTSAQKTKLTQYENALKAIKTSQEFTDGDYDNITYPTKPEIL